ncbi:MAG: helix-turn-helix domain-containing protein [Kiritimatiellae bacterium]|nr:helix-turn-helix domain-containing protein [Kiritimatiellia bacterium]
MGDHPAYFAGEFKRCVGISPRPFINRARIERAQRLLIASRDSIKQVARAVQLVFPAPARLSSRLS